MNETKGDCPVWIELVDITSEEVKRVPVQEDGYAGKLPAGDYGIVLEPYFWVGDKRIIAFGIGSRDKLIPLPLNDLRKAHRFSASSAAQGPLEGRAFYLQSVNVRVNEKGINKSHYPKNLVCFAEFTGPGKGTIEQVALVGQDGKFFLVKEKIVDFQFYLNESKQAVCNNLPKRWRGIHKMLIDGLKACGYDQELPPIADRKNDNWASSKEDSPDYVGRALSWNSATGNGLVILPWSDVALVTWRDVLPRSPNGLRYLVPREKIHYETSNDVSAHGFDFQVHNVRPLNENTERRE